MNCQLQIVVIFLLGAGCYAMPPCVEDVITKNNLMGEPVQEKSRKQGVAVCPSQSLVLTELEVTVEVGSGYNRTTQREQCWVDKDQDVRYEKCLAKQCSKCETRGAARCVPVLQSVTFRAFCKPKMASTSTTTTTTTTTTKAPKVHGFLDFEDEFGSFGQGDVLAYSSKGGKTYSTEKEQEEDAKPECKGPCGKIRDITLDLPVCCQCQVLKC